MTHHNMPVCALLKFIDLDSAKRYCAEEFVDDLTGDKLRTVITTSSFTLAAYAEGDEKAPKIAIVLPGLLDTKDYAHMRSHVSYLASQGYYALSFDPPGTWESPGDIGRYTTSSYVQAVNELIDYLGNKSTFLIGHSRGSSVAAIVGMESRAVTSFAAIMCSLFPGRFRNATDDEWKKTGVSVNMRDMPPGGGRKTERFELPYGFFEDQKLHDIADGLAVCAKPKLFVYGIHDEMAQPVIVRELYDLAAEPKKLYGIDSDHNYRLHQDLIDEVNDVVGDFLRETTESVG